VRQLALPAAILLLALVVAAVVFVARGLEEVREEVETGPTGAALDNPYLALERLLSRLGVEARSAPLLSDLPAPAPEVVFLLAPSRREWSTRDERLLEWVDRGGHLVLGAMEGEDPFLDWLGLERDGWMIRARDGSWDFVDEPDWERTGRPVYAVSFPRNAGRVTVLTGHEALAGKGLAEEGRAELAWELACLGGRPARALVVYGDDFPGLAALLWRHARPLVVSTLVLVAAALWGASRRFGPILPDPEPGRRSLAEHVLAGGRLLWRYRRVGPLLSGVREELRARVRVRHPELAHLEPPELAARLGPLLRLPADELEAALSARPGRLHAEEFTRVVRLLARARRELE
jgi:hypothetical protein